MSILKQHAFQFSASTSPWIRRTARSVRTNYARLLAFCTRKARILFRKSAKGFTALRQDLILAALALDSCARRTGTRIRLPQHLCIPTALFGYLLLFFSLEAVFLQTFLPMETDVELVPIAQNISPLPDDIDPDSVEHFRDIIDVYVPGNYATHAHTRQVLASLVPSLTSPQAMEAEDAYTLLASPTRHTMLSVPGKPSPIPAFYDSVRLPVTRYSVRLPVDPNAYHPLDKESFLVAATDRGRLRRAFARVRLQGSTSRHHPNSVSTAIAAPMTRLDKLRMADARRHHLGNLSAMFESGVRGVYAIGWDPMGGTSYGKYQLSSRQGAMRQFMKYLDKRASSWAQRLRRSGIANTGGITGGMPQEWKRIAGEHTRLFEKLQDDFVHSHYYFPTLRAVKEKTGIDIDSQPSAVREVLWSTAVLHGPTGGARIFIAAGQRTKDKSINAQVFAKALLEEVFRERERRIANMPTPQRPAVRNRLRQEKRIALARLGQSDAVRAAISLPESLL